MSSIDPLSRLAMSDAEIEAKEKEAQEFCDGLFAPDQPMDERKKKILRQILRHADRNGKWIVPGHSKLDDGEYIFDARVYTSWRAGGHSYFATVSKKLSGGTTETLFHGVWYAYTNTLHITTMIEGEWIKKIEKIVVPA